MAATSGLVSAAANLSTLALQWQQLADHVLGAATDMTKAVIRAHRDLASVLDHLSATHDELTTAYQQRFGQPAYGSSYSAEAMAPEQWNNAAQEATTRLRTANVPWTEKGRKQVQADFTKLVTDLLGRYEPTVRKFTVGEWQLMRTVGEAEAANVRAAYINAARRAALPPAPIGPRTSPIVLGNAEPTGPGPLNLFLGNLVTGSLTFSSTSHKNYETVTHALNLPEVRIPVVLDLDAVGAFVVSERTGIEGPILNLLSALPANQLLLKIFDPEHGGNSAKFLFGLGDSADRVIGDKVKTSDRELADLLQSTEEHITFVTQRFLQGEHKSLSEYNRAAGEVAEPYQLLVLYDFPSGFSRGGHQDDDQIDRIGKIIRNGPRTGVFTILVSSNPSGAVPKITSSLPWFLSSGAVSAHTINAMKGWPNSLRLPENVPAAKGSGTTATLTVGDLSWRFEPAPAPAAAVATSQLDAVKRNMHTSEDVKVTPQRVAQLAEQAQLATAATLGERVAPSVADPDRPETWWRANSSRAVAAHFGRIGARQVADLIVDSESDSYAALIGGRPGSGKSVLIHAVIMSIVMEYSPSEVELFLIDFKEGVEFKQYADVGLAHARVIAIESERDFGLSVLQRARDEIKRRGEMFRDLGQGAVKLDQFRFRTSQPLPRLILIVDEFQQLFYRDDKIAAEAAEILELILRQGRAFGVHVLLASQSLAGMASLGKHVLGLIPTRIALQSNESDSRMILGEENSDAQTLMRAGEGILNRKGGAKDANERFQAAFWDPDERAVALESLAWRAKSEGHPDITTVFAGHRAAEVESLDRSALVPAGAGGIGIPVGLPLTLDPLPLFARLRRDAGSNLLIVDEHGDGPLTVAVASLHLQGATVDLLDFVGDDDQWADTTAKLDAVEGITVHRRRSMKTALADLAAVVEERHSLNDFKASPHVLAIAAMGRARDIDPSDSYDDDAPSTMLGKILRDGPEVGVHVLTWFDRPAGINKRLDNQQLGEFGLRLVGPLSRDDSSNLTDGDNAAALKAGQGLLADIDHSTEAKVRKFGTPDPAWLAQFGPR